MSNDIVFGTIGWLGRIAIRHDKNIWVVDGISHVQRNIRIVRYDSTYNSHNSDDRINVVRDWTGVGVTLYGKTVESEHLTSVSRDELTKRYQIALSALNMPTLSDGFLSSNHGSNPTLSNGKIAYRFCAGSGRATITRISKPPQYLWPLDPCLISSAGEIVVPASDIVSIVHSNKGMLFDPLAWSKKDGKYDEFMLVKWEIDKPHKGILAQAASSV